ncbi:MULTISPECIES: hypothetical protein [unclassified Streptomyces]|uniref:hypothetical protein n=1 Tax=unclassified Streptomyces TaxID=2593676 RepID=UPI000701BDC0|nr:MULTISPECIES: hypothetical protein [unclassified Streptomyces]KQX50970.1 hypothetical protein ASD33_13270 [Streptomyces sp. Root1304]KRA85136.1 hypothetical protein ASE09_13275 [Streptomyces sp. Root66D1]
MSAPSERPTLAPSLYAYAKGLRDSDPDGPPPQGGHPVPDSARPRRRRPGLRHQEACAAVTDTLLPFLGALEAPAAGDLARAAAEADAALAATGVVREPTVYSAAAAIEPPGAPAARALARSFARHLVRTGTTLPGVSAGLGLLSRLAEPEDVPYLRVLGLLDGLVHPVDTALGPLDPEAAALVWLIHRPQGEELRALVDTLAAGDRAAVPDRLLALPTERRGVGPEAARRVAEAVGLAALLRSEPDHLGLLARAVWLLTRMTSSRDYRAEILRYGEAVDLYEAVAAHAHRLPREVEHRARLLTLAQDLRGGASHLLPWPSGRREILHRSLLDTAARPGETPADRAERQRADWIGRTARQLRAAPQDPPRFRIEVAVADPGDPDVVETRFLVDGRPLVPEAFGRGPGESPERLLDSGALRAVPEPREVRLAEAYCTEGCCGALYVTVRREDEHVVWSDWRRPGGPARQPDLPAYRFDAAAYDAEVARAEHDHDWTWPARRTSRLITAGLRDRPDLLTRWGLRQGWISTDFRERDTTVVTFDGPPLGTPDRNEEQGGTRQFLWYLPDDGRPPEEQAAAVLRRLAAEDPRTYPELAG